MNKVKIAFLFQVPSFWPSWESLYIALAKNPQFEVRLFWVNGNSGDKAQMINGDRFLQRMHIPYEEYTHERIMEFAPNWLVYQTPYDSGHRDREAWSIRYKMQGMKIVYIPYGIEISDTKESRYKHFSLPVVLNADRIFTMSKAMKQEYEKYCLNYEAVRAFGLPRFDSLAHEYPLSQEILARAQNRQIVLWKVHFPKVFVENGIKKQATPNLQEYLKFAEWIRTQKDLFFIFMPHPKFTDETIDTELRIMAIALMDTLKELSNVYIDNADDYRNSLVNAKAIIVDRSAIMVEAGYTGVPVLYMHNDVYEEPMTPPIEEVLSSYYQGTVADDMIKFCENIKEGIDIKGTERRKTFSDNVCDTNGNATQDIVNELTNYVGEKTHVIIPSKKSKIIICGMGELGDICLSTYNRINCAEFEVIACADKNQNLQGQVFYEIEVISYDKISEKNYDYIVIASDKYYKEIFEELTLKIEVDKNKIIGYDQFIIMCEFDIEK